MSEASNSRLLPSVVLGARHAAPRKQGSRAGVCVLTYGKMLVER